MLDAIYCTSSSTTASTFESWAGPPGNRLTENVEFIRCMLYVVCGMLYFTLYVVCCMRSPKWRRFGTEMGPEWCPKGGLERPEALPSPPETPLRLHIDFDIDFGSILGALLPLC